MAITIFDEINSNIDCEIINKVYDSYLNYFDLEDKFEIELCIVDEDTIRFVNNQSRNIDQSTDVLSFPAVEFRQPFVLSDYKDDIDPMTGNLMFGEIMLCASIAEEQAKEYGHSFQRECAYLVLHGLLHLMGFDHMQDSDKLTMREHEEGILSLAGYTRD